MATRVFAVTIALLQARLFLEIESGKEALRWSLYLLKAFPACLPAWFNAGLAYEQLGRLEEAVDCFETILLHDPANEAAQLCVSAVERKIRSHTYRHRKHSTFGRLQCVI